MSFTSLPAAAVTFTVKVTIAVPFTARSPMAHRTVAVPVQVPAVVETLAKVLPTGTLSLTTTLVAGSGPLLTTVME